MKVFCDDFIPKFNKEIVKRGKKKYLKAYMSFDSETSWNHDEENPVGWIFQWCFRIEEEIVIGRKPSQFIDCLKRILLYTNDCDCKIIIFIHNLSYDLQYLKNFLIREFCEYKILATSPHKFITFTIDKFEFRCTYRLSNRSLSKWAKDLGVGTQKLVDTVNYNDIHTQQESLPDIWWEYQIADVNCLHECVEKQMQIYKDTLATLPLTSTGYVRRECRRNYRKDTKNRKKFLNTKTKADIYTMLDKSFMGGISHGNRFYIEETVSANIRHRDFVSHYPSQQRVRKFPIGKFNLYTENASISDVRKCVKDGYNCIIEIMITDVVLRDNNITIPYLSESKVLLGKCGFVKCLKDNGRILKAKGTFVLYLTEIDLDIILRQYNIGSYNILKMYISKSGYLPEYLIKTIDEFFIDKTKYKILSKNENDVEKQRDFKISLMKAKNGLNGIYGMTAQRPIRDEIEMELTGEFITNKTYTIEGIQEKLNEYYNNKNSFMRFAFGVWCTAWARWELIRYCEIIGYKNVLYCDTDSAFYISTPEIEKRIEEENKRCLDNSESIGAFIEYENEKVYYDQFTDENENITEFRFLHSKCYAYKENDTLHVTIAGVPSSTYDYESGKRITREEELGDISELKDGKIFTINGGTKSCYVESEISEYMNQEIASSCIITNTTKTLKNFENQTLTMGKWEVLEDD